MQTATTDEEDVSAKDWVDVQRGRWWETTYTAVSWEYPPPSSSYYQALLSRGASGSRLLRIAYSSQRERLRTPRPFSGSSSSHTTTPTRTPSLTSTSPSTPTDLTSTTSLTSPSSSPPKSALLLPPLASSSSNSLYLNSLSHMHVHFRFGSPRPTPHTMKRRAPQWPKPPHYHASLLRSSLSRRRGRFRSMLPPSEAVDFFRRDITRGGSGPSSISILEDSRRREMGWNSSSALSVVESVLGPYEARAGFFGWRGLGLEMIQGVDRDRDDKKDVEIREREDESEGEEGDVDGVGDEVHFGLDVLIDERTVEEGRSRWIQMARGLVGPLPKQAASHHKPASNAEYAENQKTITDSSTSSNLKVPVGFTAQPSSSRDEVRWNPDPHLSPFCPSTPNLPKTDSTSGGNTSSKPETKNDSSLGWWYAPAPHAGPPPPQPHYPPLRFPPPPQYSPWYAGMGYPPTPTRAGPGYGNGYWYTARGGGPGTGTNGVSTPSLLRDPDFTVKLPPPPPLHFPTTPHTPHNPASQHSPHSPRASPRHLHSDLDRTYQSGRERDQENETDRGYESAATTTDSDPVPRTPTGTGIPARRVAVGDDVNDDTPVLEIREGYAAASVEITSSARSGPTTPVKFPSLIQTLPHVASSPSASSTSSTSPVSHWHSKTKSAVLFPSLNGTFRQVSSHTPSFSSSGDASLECTPARVWTPVPSSAAVLSARLGLGAGVEVSPKETKRASEGAISTTGLSTPPLLSPSPTLSLSSSSSNPLAGAKRMSPGFRKDSQGFWEPVTPPISPSSSSLPKSSCARSPSGSGSSSDKLTTSSGASDIFALSPSPTSNLKASSPSNPVTASSELRCPSSSTPTLSPSSNTPSACSSQSPSLPPNPTTLLPAFLASAAKRKKASRTREIVDRLRSAGDGSTGFTGLDWSSNSTGASLDLNGVSVDKVAPTTDSPSSEGSVGVVAEQVSPATKSKSKACLELPWLGSESGAGQDKDVRPRSESCDRSSSSGSSSSIEGGNGMGPSGTRSPSTALTTASAVNTSKASKVVSPNPGSRSGWIEVGGPKPVVTSSASGDRSKLNTSISSGSGLGALALQLSGATNPPGVPGATTLPSHPTHSLSPAPLTLQSPPTLAPPPQPMFAVPYYPYPAYGYPYAQYLGPGQGAWVAVYRPPNPPHPHSHPAHPVPITGASGMKHTSW